MGILDKLRPQPRWKHGDPMVRLEAVQALDATETDVLVQVATEDSDARVRRTAVGRLADADVLAAVTRNDSDGFRIESLFETDVPYLRGAAPVERFAL